MKELEGGGEQEVGDHLGQHQGQQDGRLVQGAPGDGQQLLPLEYHSATIKHMKEGLNQKKKWVSILWVRPSEFF